jgi:hypothetical protein
MWVGWLVAVRRSCLIIQPSLDIRQRRQKRPTSWGLLYIEEEEEGWAGSPARRLPCEAKWRYRPPPTLVTPPVNIFHTLARGSMYSSRFRWIGASCARTRGMYVNDQVALV